MPSLYSAKISQADKIAYRTGMGPLPYILSGIGFIFADVIIGLILVLEPV